MKLTELRHYIDELLKICDDDEVMLDVDGKIYAVKKLKAVFEDNRFICGRYLIEGETNDAHP